jgi:hypothetical protein
MYGEMRSAQLSGFQTESIDTIGETVAGIDFGVVNFLDHPTERGIVRTHGLGNDDHLVDAAGKDIQVTVF